jgi:hypothetical protein
MVVAIAEPPAFFNRSSLLKQTAGDEYFHVPTIDDNSTSEEAISPDTILPNVLNPLLVEDDVVVVDFAPDTTLPKMFVMSGAADALIDAENSRPAHNDIIFFIIIGYYVYEFLCLAKLIKISGAVNNIIPFIVYSH